jgi:uncharacterized membrane protein YkvA (DUF1232 family)
MTFLGLIGVLLICCTVLLVTLLVLACLPHSPIRDLLFQLFAWLFAGSCGAYFLLPCDLCPELILGPLGLFDDVIAVLMGIVSLVAAIKSAREARSHARARRWEAEEAAKQPSRRQKTITARSRPARLKASRKT